MVLPSIPQARAYVCRFCASPFTPLREWQAFCTPEHRTQYHRERQVAKVAKRAATLFERMAALERRVAELERQRSLQEPYGNEPYGKAK